MARHADAADRQLNGLSDVQRMLDSSTGTFHDDPSRLSTSFKKAQSKSEGTASSVGQESQDGEHAQVLVVVTVKTSNPGAPEQDPRRWRMQIAVQKVGDRAKVSNVEFVP